MNVQQKDIEIKKQLEYKKKLETLGKYQEDDRVVPAPELADEVSQAIKKTEQISTGFPTLDRYIDKLESGELIVLGGFPNMGKTPFMLNLVQNFSKNNINSLYCTYEIHPKKLVERQNSILENNFHALSFYLPRENIERNLDWLQDRVIEAKIKYGVKVVFIDYLDYLISVQKGDIEERAISETVKFLKHTIAVTEDIVVMVAAAINREAKDMSKPPHYRQLKGSSSIEYTADQVWMIHRLPDLNDYGKPDAEEDGQYKYTQCKSKLYIQKSRRNGFVGGLEMKHDVKTKLFIEIDGKHI